jgi:hypothetical protein
METVTIKANDDLYFGAVDKHYGYLLYPAYDVYGSGIPARASVDVHWLTVYGERRFVCIPPKSLMTHLIVSGNTDVLYKRDNDTFELEPLEMKSSSKKSPAESAAGLLDSPPERNPTMLIEQPGGTVSDEEPPPPPYNPDDEPPPPAEPEVGSIVSHKSTKGKK